MKGKEVCGRELMDNGVRDFGLKDVVSECTESREVRV